MRPDHWRITIPLRLLLSTFSARFLQPLLRIKESTKDTGRISKYEPLLESGGREGIRTPALLVANEETLKLRTRRHTQETGISNLPLFCGNACQLARR